MKIVFASVLFTVFAESVFTHLLQNAAAGAKGAPHTHTPTAAAPHLPTTAAATGKCNKSLTTRLFVQQCEQGEHKWLLQGVDAEATQTAWEVRVSLLMTCC